MELLEQTYKKIEKAETKLRFSKLEMDTDETPRKSRWTYKFLENIDIETFNPLNKNFNPIPSLVKNNLLLTDCLSLPYWIYEPAIKSTEINIKANSGKGYFRAIEMDDGLNIPEIKELKKPEILGEFIKEALSLKKFSETYNRDVLEIIKNTERDYSPFDPSLKEKICKLKEYMQGINEFKRRTKELDFFGIEPNFKLIDKHLNEIEEIKTKINLADKKYNRLKRLYGKLKTRRGKSRLFSKILEKDNELPKNIRQLLTELNEEESFGNKIYLDLYLEAIQKKDLDEDLICRKLIQKCYLRTKSDSNNFCYIAGRIAEKNRWDKDALTCYLKADRYGKLYGCYFFM